MGIGTAIRVTSHEAIYANDQVPTPASIVLVPFIHLLSSEYAGNQLFRPQNDGYKLFYMPEPEKANEFMCQKMSAGNIVLMSYC